MYTKSVIIPRHLVKGDLIGIAAPASSFDVAELDKGASVLESMGFRLIIPEGIYRRRGYLAGSDVERAVLLNELFKNRQVKAIICARGGFGSTRILQYLDYKAIRENPKIFVGFSDITAILSALYIKCRLVTYHGPMVTTLGQADRMTRESLMSVLLSDSKFELKPKNCFVIQSGVAAGPVVGGNLSILCSLMGTPAQPDYNGRILFLEDRSEAPYRIDRMLIQMKQSGCLERLAGLILGSFEGCGQYDEVMEIVADIIRDFDFPVMAGFEAGHGRTNLTFPMGLEAILDTEERALSFSKDFLE